VKVRIGAENSCERVKGLPTPHLDLVFEKDDSPDWARMYIVEQGEAISDYGPPSPYLRVTISDLAAVVAALCKVSVESTIVANNRWTKANVTKLHAAWREAME